MAELETLVAHSDALLQIRRSLGVYLLGHPGKGSEELSQACDHLSQAHRMVETARRKSGER